METHINGEYAMNETFFYVGLFMQASLLSALAAFVWVSESPSVSVTNEHGSGGHSQESPR